MTGFELREAADGVHLQGYASVTETPYAMGFYREIVARYAFKRTLANPNLSVKLLVNHSGLPLASTTNGSLRLREDRIGLRVDATMNPADPDVQAVVPKLRDGLLDEMSFAFKVTDQDWSDDRTLRTIRAVDLHRGDVSLVTYGASSATSAHLRHSPLGEARASVADVPFEERQRLAFEIGQRWSGGVALGLRASTCSTCEGSGKVTVSFEKVCPDCGDSDVESSSAASRRPSASDPAVAAAARRQAREEAELIAWAQRELAGDAERVLRQELQREMDRRRGERERAKRAEADRVEELRRIERAQRYG
jgi:uncharacterized protein